MAHETEAELKAHDAAIREICRDREIKRISDQAVLQTHGTIKIGDGTRKHYKLTKPLPQKGREGGGEDAWVRFAGMIEIEGQPPKPYLVFRKNHPGGWSESSFYIDGVFMGSMKRDWLPRTFEHSGTFNVNGQAYAYKIRDTMTRDGVNFKRDELEALAMMMVA
jgi:hypothetical protein